MTTANLFDMPEQLESYRPIVRTDIHRPSAIVPEDYEFVSFDYIRIDNLGDCYMLREQREIKAAHFARTGGKYSQHEHGGVCMICGNSNAVYTCTFYHGNTNTYLRTGQDCAQKLDLSTGDFNRFTAAIHNAIEAQAGKRKAQAVLENAGLSAAWQLYTCDSLPAGRLPYEEATILDIVGKLVKYGSISDKATTFLGNLLAQIPRRAEIAASRAAEKAAAMDAPTGKRIVSGEVLKAEFRDSAYGEQYKMLVKSAEGWLVWSTVPRALGTVKRGDRVTFQATLQPSKDDAKFCFASRPTVPKGIQTITGGQQ